MKIIITESQFYNLLPNEIKRRLSQEDIQILDGYIQHEKKVQALSFGSDSSDAADFVYEVVRNSFNDFINEHKVPYPMINNDEGYDVYKKTFDLYWPILPFLLNKYHDELWAFITNLNS
jgi:3'-phosphoadenosine 5'-phosphosulfate sulfotransferase (PAPS reductase)/FAD synthetase